VRRLLRLLLTACACLAGILALPWSGHPVALAEGSLADIRVAQLHIFVVPAGDRVQVGEYYVLSNTGSATYSGSADAASGKQITLTFTLPAGATNLQFAGAGLGERFVEQPGGFADTQPIPPGQSKAEVQFSYELPYREGMQIQRTFEVSIDSLVVLITGQGMAIEGQGLKSLGSIDTQMGPALYYQGGPLAPNQPVVFTVTGQASSQPSGTGTEALAVPVARSNGAEAGVGLLALLAAAVGAHWLLRKPAASKKPAGVAPLIQAIAELDEDFEAGRLPKEAYRGKRAALLKQTRALLTTPGAGAG
jgi:hypothetical protein